MNNPHGILFNPLSVASSLDSYVQARQYDKDDLFFLNEIWNSWDHHTRFSHIHQQAALDGINQSQQEAAAFIRQADWIIITLGSAFQYYLTENNKPVANNHRAPGQWFEKRLLSIDAIEAALRNTIQGIRAVNAEAAILFTISPVRHIRDGVVANNRSKARLLEVVHTLCESLEQTWYFPAYELVIDVLRDYRFYDIDLVHPNYPATQAVWEHFVACCMDADTQHIMKAVKELTTAAAHRPRFPETAAHRRFLENHYQKAQALMAQYPYLDLQEELQYFATGEKKAD